MQIRGRPTEERNYLQEAWAELDAVGLGRDPLYRQREPALVLLRDAVSGLALSAWMTTGLWSIATTDAIAPFVETCCGMTLLALCLRMATHEHS